MSNDAIKIENLSYKRHRYTILDNVSFHIPKNTISIFIGNNGAGKTTTIRSIFNLIPYKNGKISILDVDAKKPQSHIDVGYLTEKEPTYLIQTSYQFLYEQAQLSLFPKIDINTIITKYTKLFGVSNKKMNMPFKFLSSGLKKIIMIINAFIIGKKLIILDEPTEFLDPKSRHALREAILEAKKDEKTIFLSTHSLDDVDEMAEWIVIIDDGKIKYCGNRTKGSLHKFFKMFWDI